MVALCFLFAAAFISFTTYDQIHADCFGSLKRIHARLNQRVIRLVNVLWLSDIRQSCAASLYQPVLASSCVFHACRQRVLSQTWTLRRIEQD